jgi:oleate hydratase
MEELTGNTPGTGALVTLKESNWLLSVVLAYQPHFLNQPTDVTVFWGYGLFVEKEGNYVKKKMSECTGEEILVELLSHLRFQDDTQRIIDTSTCIPCMMPYITSQFLTRAKGDRPQVVPERASNLAFLGQFAEVPEDVVFTVEYSVRTAQTAVYTLLGLEKKPLPMYEGQYDLRVLVNALKTLLT